MKKIKIRNFATISNLDLVLDKKIDIVIGAQASGKSTLAKTIYFCRKMKDYMLEYLADPKNFTSVHPNEYFSYFLKYIRKQFMGCFGTTKHMRPFQIDFFYNWSSEESETSPNIKKVSLVLDQSGFVKVVFSRTLADIVRKLIEETTNLYRNAFVHDPYSIESLLVDLKTRHVVKSHFSAVISDVLEDGDEILYIPAGRSILATLSEQLNDLDVSIMDLPLQEFVTLIKDTKKRFGTKIPDIVSNYTKTVDGQIKNSDVKTAYELIREILRGDYVNDSDGEKLYYKNNEYVKLMYASSGQQEVLWILLLIFIKILEQKKVFLVLEEPEAHLFPSAQKSIVDLIALLVNSTESSVLITTHSPYILTSMNLCIYSAKIENRIVGNSNPVVYRRLRISPSKVDAFMISNGENFSFRSIKDSDEQLIDATQIDQISNVINSKTDKIIDMEIENDL